MAALGLPNVSRVAKNPLAVEYPSPFFLLNYPLVLTNVKMLCEKERGKSRPSSLTATWLSIQHAYKTEGVLGLYHGGHIYLLHQVCRGGLRWATDRCLAVLERRGLLGLGPPPLENAPLAPPEAAASAAAEKSSAEEARERLRYRVRTAAKYVIDAACYPILLTSTRGVVLRADPSGTWERVCFWCSREGAQSLFRGVTASLASAGCDEAMEVALSSCMDVCTSAAGAELEMTDRLMLGATAQSVLSFFTAPINMVGVIQRCQSSLIPGLPEPRDLWETVKDLPWRSFCYQLLVFSGVLALQIRLVQMKMEEGLAVQDREEDREE